MRRFGRPAAVVAAVAVAVVGLVVVRPGHESRAGAAAAYRHGQVITVKVSSPASRTGVLEAWELTASGAYRRVYGPAMAHVGSAGVGAAREGLARTPAGVFGLTQTFGLAANPGTRLPWFTVDNLDWWDGDQASPSYSRHARCAPGHCPFDEGQSEHLASISVYRYAAVINYNTGPITPGAGSAFFLHVTNNQPTGGCVAIAQAQLVTLLRWLRPSARPVISIGVGNQAYAPMPVRR